ncbi:hypothetical protein F5B20DRAFT_593922 [Whalleya microplaca]|nr:hypothetical protein F5B20DRAFT_593922 [Whalleya microplaca]
MLMRDLKRLLVVVGPLLLFFYTIFKCLDGEPRASYQVGGDWIGHVFSTGAHGPVEQASDAQSSPSKNAADEGAFLAPECNATHTELQSVSTADRSFFRIQFGDKHAMNPNILPHPLLEDTWTVVAQQHEPDNPSHARFVELACDAAFAPAPDGGGGSVLQCILPPVALPIASTGPGHCAGELAYMGLNIGPHDARVFHGPRGPLAIYGSNSQETCFGQWMQDFRVLINWAPDTSDTDVSEPFRMGTELRRPPPRAAVEKNWFVFWDARGELYAHYDVAPRRAFAALGADGSAGPDLAPAAAAAGDERCLARHMPALSAAAQRHESVHQATNSLAITLCARADTRCAGDNNDSNDGGDNTFLLTIFQHKTFYGFHSVYEPYVLLFARRPPFAVHGISARPLWIRGRGGPGRMLYVTSVSWKARGQTYHGYLDDVVFVAFGIEDEEAGGIDVLARDLLAGLGLCSDIPAS